MLARNVNLTPGRVLDIIIGDDARLPGRHRVRRWAVLRLGLLDAGARAGEHGSRAAVRRRRARCR